jgi:hypothetical protein
MVNPITTHMKVTVFKDGQDAAANGYNYNVFTPKVRPVELKEVVVVSEGTNSGKPTVDFLVEDEAGNRYVFMVTAALLKTIPLNQAQP